MEGMGLGVSSTNDPLPSPLLSSRHESIGLAPFMGGDAGEVPTSSAKGGGEMTRGEPLREELTPPANQVEEPLMMDPTGELAQDDGVVVTEGDENHGPIVYIAREIEASSRQTSPGN